MKLLGSGPDMAAELKDGDRAEGGAEGGLPQVREALVARLQGFGDLFCLVAPQVPVGMVSKISMLSPKPIGV